MIKSKIINFLDISNRISGVAFPVMLIAGQFGYYYEVTRHVSVADAQQSGKRYVVKYTTEGDAKCVPSKQGLTEDECTEEILNQIYEAKKK